jgi:hypothetical protein
VAKASRATGGRDDRSPGMRSSRGWHSSAEADRWVCAKRGGSELAGPRRLSKQPYRPYVQYRHCTPVRHARSPAVAAPPEAIVSRRLIRALPDVVRWGRDCRARSTLLLNLSLRPSRLRHVGADAFVTQQQRRDPSSPALPFVRLRKSRPVPGSASRRTRLACRRDELLAPNRDASEASRDSSRMRYAAARTDPA